MSRPLLLVGSWKCIVYRVMYLYTEYTNTNLNNCTNKEIKTYIAVNILDCRIHSENRNNVIYVQRQQIEHLNEICRQFVIF